jgi:acetyl esterase/lipase
MRALAFAVAVLALLPAAGRASVQYGTGQTAAGPVPLRLDVYQPHGQTKRPRPVVVLIHGGGFRTQSRTAGGIVRIARGLADEGIVAVSIDYRLMPQSPIPSARVRPLLDALPDIPIRAAVVAAADDTLTALRFLRAHARQLRIDPDRLGLIGASAGAITADQVAYALDDLGIAVPRIRFVGSLWGGIPDVLGAQGLRRGEAPLFSVHGDADPTVPVAWEDALQARARAQGVRAVYDRVPGGAHGYGGTQFFTRDTGRGLTAYERLLAFAEQHLG